jgi:hypothetical protein
LGLEFFDRFFPPRGSKLGWLFRAQNARNQHEQAKAVDSNDHSDLPLLDGVGESGMAIKASGRLHRSRTTP